MTLIKYSSFISNWGWKLKESRWIKEIPKKQFEEAFNKMTDTLKGVEAYLIRLENNSTEEPKALSLIPRNHYRPYEKEERETIQITLIPKTKKSNENHS